MIDAIIVEDELAGITSLKGLIDNFIGDCNILAAYQTVDAAIIGIQELKPDLIFLDIEIGNETGFDLLNKISKFDFEVVFTTAHVHYALRAIKFAAIDYLLKPINVEDLKLTIRKVNEKIELKNNFKNQFELFKHSTFLNQKDKQKIALPTREGFNFICINDILYCEADGAYTQFHLQNKKTILVSKNLKDFEEILFEYDFFRVHHSFLINLAEISKYIKGDGGIVVMSDGSNIDVSKRKKDAFLHAISLKK